MNEKQYDQYARSRGRRAASVSFAGLCSAALLVLDNSPSLEGKCTVYGMCRTNHDHCRHIDRKVLEYFRQGLVAASPAVGFVGCLGLAYVFTGNVIQGR